MRLNATGRYLGFLVGPLLGAALLLRLGPARGIFVNALIYTPLLIWLINAPYGGAAKEPGAARPAVRGFADMLRPWRWCCEIRVLLSMTVLVGAASFFVGNAYQAQMPEFASDLQHGRPNFTYGLLARGRCGRRPARRPDPGDPGLAQPRRARPSCWR